MMPSCMYIPKEGFLESLNSSFRSFGLYTLPIRVHRGQGQENFKIIQHRFKYINNSVFRVAEFVSEVILTVKLPK